MSQRDVDNVTGQSPDPALEQELDRLGRLARTQPGLASRVFEHSVEHLPAPRSLPFEPLKTSRIATWTRVALAASLLLAFAVAARLLLSGGGDANDTGDRDRMVADNATSTPDDYDDLFPSERDTVLVALLDAGSRGRIEAVEYLEGSDAVGAAFAPILGTTGFGMDDFAVEIQSIEVDLRR